VGCSAGTSPRAGVAGSNKFQDLGRATANNPLGALSFLVQPRSKERLRYIDSVNRRSVSTHYERNLKARGFGDNLRIRAPSLGQLPSLNMRAISRCPRLWLRSHHEQKAALALWVHNFGFPLTTRTPLINMPEKVSKKSPKHKPLQQHISLGIIPSNIAVGPLGFRAEPAATTKSEQSLS